MSKTTKRKHVFEEVLGDYVLPREDQLIVKVVQSKGNNLHEVQAANNEKFLVTMPTKFRKTVWIKRGDYLIVDPIEEGDKVKAEITAILYKKQIKHIQEQHLWPENFMDKVKVENNDYLDKVEKLQIDCVEKLQIESDEYSSDNDDDLFVNTNRPTIVFSESSEESSGEENE